MTIESNQIHNVVRTYERSLQLSPSAWRDAEQAGYVEEDQISISAHACGLGVIHPIDEVHGIAT